MLTLSRGMLMFVSCHIFVAEALSNFHLALQVRVCWHHSRCCAFLAAQLRVMRPNMSSHSYISSGKEFVFYLLHFSL
jgi:hypothetical protein